MNILYITKLDGRPWAGPTYSVPKQIDSQNNFDNVFWYNILDAKTAREEGVPNIEKWKRFPFYHDSTEFPTKRIESLPSPFNKPDLIIFEQCYPFYKEGIRKEVEKSKIPYIVIPRGEFTKKAQKKHWLKKKIGNLLLGYRGFLRSAVALQCLTEQESNNTDLFWNKRRIIIPNGVNVRSEKKVVSSKSGSINCVYIGRYEPYQKGLDSLLNCIYLLKNELIEKHFCFNFYGSNVEKKRQLLEEMVASYSLGDLVSLHDGVFGKEKEDILLGADVFVMTSRFEGHPMGLLEALSYGIPCFVSKGTNMRREIEQFDCGWGSDDSVDSLYISMKKMIDDVGNLSAKRENALELAKLYDWNSLAKRAHIEYTEAINKS